MPNIPASVVAERQRRAEQRERERRRAMGIEVQDGAPSLSFLPLLSLVALGEWADAR